MVFAWAITCHGISGTIEHPISIPHVSIRRKPQYSTRMAAPWSSLHPRPVQPPADARGIREPGNSSPIRLSSAPLLRKPAIRSMAWHWQPIPLFPAVSERYGALIGSHGSVLRGTSRAEAGPLFARWAAYIIRHAMEAERRAEIWSTIHRCNAL